MELCPEGTLESLIMGTENGLPESTIRRFTKQLVNAISTLHENSIVHRDIKRKYDVVIVIFIFYLL